MTIRILRITISPRPTASSATLRHLGGAGCEVGSGGVGGRADTFARRVAADLQAAGARVRDKINRDGIGSTLRQVAREVGRRMKEDVVGVNKRARARDLGSHLGQITGKIADRVDSSNLVKTLLTGLVGSLSAGLKRAGLYTPTAVASARRDEPVK